jgi:ABC-type multidrug transport system ATPase subunit
MMLLQIQNLSFSYNRKARIFSHFGLELHDGINVILGANGSGKTTLFRILATVMEQKSGVITLNGIAHPGNDYRKSISYIPQNFNVYPHVIVRHFLEFVGKVKYGYDAVKMREEIERVSEAADITSFLDQKIGKISGGMRQRIGIAQAIIGNPALIIADEPTAGLDPEQRNKFNMVLKRIMRDKIILLSTHIIEDVREYYDHVVIISSGKITFQGDYTALANSLNGKLVEFTVNIGELEEIEKMCRVLSKDYQGESVAVKAVMDNPKAGMNKPTPTLTDIWTYYR